MSAQIVTLPSRFITQGTRVRAYIADDDGVQQVKSDFTDWMLSVYEANPHDPILQLTGQSIDSFYFDAPQLWKYDLLGYTFLHELDYGEEYDDQTFTPRGGKTLRMEFTLNRTDDREPIVFVVLQPMKNVQGIVLED